MFIPKETFVAAIK